MKSNLTEKLNGILNDAKHRMPIGRLSCKTEATTQNMLNKTSQKSLARDG